MILKFKIGGMWVDILPKENLIPKKALKTQTVSSFKISLGKVCMRQGQMSTYFGFYREVVYKNVNQSIHSVAKYVWKPRLVIYP